MTLIDGRIGMPVPWIQASWPFMPRSAALVRLSTVRPPPMSSARTAMPAR